MQLVQMVLGVFGRPVQKQETVDRYYPKHKEALTFFEDQMKRVSHMRSIERISADEAAQVRSDIRDLSTYIGTGYEVAQVYDDGFDLDWDIKLRGIGFDCHCKLSVVWFGVRTAQN